MTGDLQAALELQPVMEGPLSELGKVPSVIPLGDGNTRGLLPEKEDDWK